MTKRKRTRKPANPLSRVRPIARPHELLHRAKTWEMNYVPGDAWPWYTVRFSRLQPATNGNTRNVYWLHWNAEEHRFAGGTDSAHFRQHEPMICEWIGEWLRAHLLDRVRALSASRQTVASGH